MKEWRVYWKIDRRLIPVRFRGGYTTAPSQKAAENNIRYLYGELVLKRQIPKKELPYPLVARPVE